MRNFVLAFALLSLISCSNSKKPEANKTQANAPQFTTLEAVLASPHRSEENKARDTYRHPAETLRFFEVDPTMTVVEISPGRGWYTEILAPYMNGRGTLILAAPNEDNESEHLRTSAQEMKAKVAAQKALYGAPQFTVFAPPKIVGPIAPAGTADRVLTFRNIHNWVGTGSAEAAFKEFYTALKPGGILGVVEHRARGKKKQDPKAKSGYIREDYVIKLAEKAGFKLVGKSEINANPKDTTNHPEGVWTLPPALRLKDKDRAKYVEIGESDRMTLKFMKPGIAGAAPAQGKGAAGTAATPAASPSATFLPAKATTGSPTPVPSRVFIAPKPGAASPTPTGSKTFMPAGSPTPSPAGSKTFMPAGSPAPAAAAGGSKTFIPAGSPAASPKR